MIDYIGIKHIKAVPMTRGDYNTYRGWPIPPNENPTDDGYMVEYTDVFKPNDNRHKGYISWSPKDVFESSYCVMSERNQYGYTQEWKGASSQYVQYVNVSNQENGSTILTVRDPDGRSCSINLPPEIVNDLAFFLATRGLSFKQNPEV